MRPVLLAVLAFASIAAAQRGPLPGIPLIPPPVNHPALAAQPLIQPDNSTTRPAPAATAPAKKAPTRARPKRPVVDPDTVGAKASGKWLKKRIDKVTSLKWGKNLFELKARSAATGRPILYLQALGSLSGFA